MNIGLLYSSPFIRFAKIKDIIVKFIPGILWLLIIFILLTMPGSDIPSSDFLEIIYFDKWVHIGLFAFLTFLWQYPFLNYAKSQLKVMLIIPILALAYGIAMEFVQKYFTASRTFDVTDMIADGSGVIIAIIVSRLVAKNKPL